MGAMTVVGTQPSIIDRAAIRAGSTLVAWGRRRTELRERDPADGYRAEYAERVRTASAVVRQRLLA